jgi:hypothetical protein
VALEVLDALTAGLGMFEVEGQEQKFIGKVKSMPMPHLENSIFSRQKPLVIPTIKSQLDVVTKMTTLSMV